MKISREVLQRIVIDCICQCTYMIDDNTLSEIANCIGILTIKSETEKSMFEVPPSETTLKILIKLINGKDYNKSLPGFCPSCNTPLSEFEKETNAALCYACQDS